MRHEMFDVTAKWPLVAQRRAWIMAVAASSAMDLDEVQSLMALWIRMGDLSIEGWDRMRQLAQYVTTEEYVRDETERKMRLLGVHAAAPEPAAKDVGDMKMIRIVVASGGLETEILTCDDCGREINADVFRR